MCLEVRKVGPCQHWHKVEGIHFVSSIYGHWARCIREQVQPFTPFLGGTDWCLPVILTLRTWAVWNRNKRLSIILLIFYNLSWGSSIFVLVRFLNSLVCMSDLHFVLDFLGWFISWQLVLRPIQDSMDVSWRTPVKILLFYGPYCLSGTPVSGNMLFGIILPLIENVVLLMLMLVPAMRECEKPLFSKFDDRFSACLYSEYQIEMGETGP